MGAPHPASFEGGIRGTVSRRRGQAAAGTGVGPDVGGEAGGAKGGGAVDLLTMLVGATDPKTGRAMTDRELADNMATFVLAGHETTAVALAWTLHLLSRHPEHEGRLVAEGEAATEGGPVRPEHVERLPFTRAGFDEACRLYPPAPIISRRVRRGFRLGAAEAEEGSVLIVPIHALHRNRLLWDAPERFDPDRFVPERARARHRYSFMPFGAGPRVCIGANFAALEAVAVLAVLLRAFRLEAVGPAPRPTMHVTLRPDRPTRMRLRARR